MIIIPMGLVSIENKITDVERVDNYIITFQLQKINYVGVDGYFIPFEGFKQLRLVLNDYIYYQDLVIIKDDRIKYLEKLELTNFKLKTGLAVSISFNVGISLVTLGLGLLLYNLGGK